MRALAALLLLAFVSAASAATLCDVKAMETSPVLVEIGSIDSTGAAELVVHMPLEAVSSTGSKYLKSIFVDFTDGSTTPGVCASLDIDNVAFGTTAASDNLDTAPALSVAKVLF